MPIVNVPFAYDIRFMPQRSKNEKELVVFDTTPVIIREASKGETQIAIVAPFEGWVVDYLSHEGCIYEPIPAAGPEGQPPDTSYPQNPFLGRSSPLRVQRKERDEIPSVLNLSIKEIISSTRDAGIADAQRRANDLLIIDGMIYEKCPGPVDSVSPPSGGRGAATLVSGSVNDPHINLGAIFRADQRDDAIEFAEALYGRPPKIACEAFIVTQSALLPDSFQEFATRNLAEYALRRATALTEIGKLPNPYLEAFLDYTEVADPADFDLDTLRGWIEVVSTSLAGSNNKDLAKLAIACGSHLDYLQRIEPAKAIAP